MRTRTGNGRNWSYTWDALGRLQQVSDGATPIAAFTYDVLDRRVSKATAGGTTIQRYVHEGDQVVLDLNNANAVTAEYGWHPGADNLFLMKTATRAGVAVTDPSYGTVRGMGAANGGAVLEQFADPISSVWGNVAADTGTVVRFRLAGGETDPETGLVYLRARYLDPTLGRFLAEDPIGIAGGLNLYSYAGNNPIGNRDPSGLDYSCDIFGIYDYNPETGYRSGYYSFFARCDRVQEWGLDRRVPAGDGFNLFGRLRDLLDQERAANVGGPSRPAQRNSARCLPAAGLFVASFAGDAALLSPVGLTARAGAFFVGKSIAARHFARSATLQGFTEATIGQAQLALEVARSCAPGTAAIALAGDVPVVVGAALHGFDVSFADFVPFVATLRARSTAFEACGIR